MPLVFIVFCSSVGSQSNIAHSTVHKMQCTKSFRKIYDMHISKLSSSNSGNACVVQRVQYSSYCTMNIFTFLRNAIHTACSAPYVQVGNYQHGKISQVHYCIYNQLVVLFSSLNKGFFFEQLLSTKVEFKIKYVLHYYAHERFNIFKPARVQT